MSYTQFKPYFLSNLYIPVPTEGPSNCKWESTTCNNQEENIEEFHIVEHLKT